MESPSILLGWPLDLSGRAPSLGVEPREQTAVQKEEFMLLLRIKRVPEPPGKWYGQVAKFLVGVNFFVFVFFFFSFFSLFFVGSAE